MNTENKDLREWVASCDPQTTAGLAADTTSDGRTEIRMNDGREIYKGTERECLCFITSLMAGV